MTAINWPAGKILHGGGLSGTRFDDYVKMCGKGHAPAMGSNFITVGKRASGASMASVAGKLATWLASEKAANRIPNVGFAMHDIFADGHTRTSNLPAVLAGKRDDEFRLVLLPLVDFKKALLLRIMLEITSDGYERDLFPAAYRYLAEKVRLIAPNVALCLCIEPSGPFLHLDDWNPGDEFWDVGGVDLYAANNFMGPLIDNRGGYTNHGRAVAMANYTHDRGKLLVIPETAAVAKGLALGTTEADAARWWDNWFLPWKAFVLQHKVAAFAYQPQTQWGGSNGWGSSEIQGNPFLAQRWREWLADPRLVHAPG